MPKGQAAKIHTIDYKRKIDDKPQAVFVIIYAVDGKPWQGNTGSYAEMSEIKIPSCLMVMRWDGTSGFVGGKVEGLETFEDTIKREMQEEIGSSLDLKLEPIVAHDIGPITTHACAAEVTYDELLKIRTQALQDVESQTTGVFCPYLVVYDDISTKKKGGLVNLLQTPFAPSVREELIHFLLKKEIFTKQKLTEIVKKAGFTLEDLLQ
jgi:8-oxo-dGTP pyrophosphatase MutT (NUDIX family)